MQAESSSPKPHILDSEHNPLVLRAIAKMLEADNQRLRDLFAKVQADELKQNQDKLNLEESIRIFRKKFFGKKSEKSVGDRDRDRLNEDAELLLHSQNLLPPPKNKAIRALESEEVIHEIEDGELKEMSASLGLENPSDEQWEEIPGLFDKSVEIVIVERQYKQLLHKRKKYRLKKEFAIEEKTVMVAARGQVKFVPGSCYSTEFVVSVIADKYLNHIPLERQCRIMDSLGLHKMHTQTLYNLARLASIYLEPIVEQIKNEVLAKALVHSDETPWPINNSKDSDGYMWIVANAFGSYYRFEPTRSGAVIRETLKDYNGTVMTDGYSGYYQYKNSETKKLALCHSHARRYFWDIKEDNPIVLEIIDLWEDLFKLEHLARTFDELNEIRDRRSRPIIEKMKTWLFEKFPESRPESPLRKAIQYSMNHWRELTKFLDDSAIPLTNNEAERTIRQAVMGRKNFYGSRSIDGADLAAIMYTVIESCKKVELDPRQYLLATIKLASAGEPTETPYQMALRLRQ
jgi:transposase